MKGSFNFPQLLSSPEWLTLFFALSGLRDYHVKKSPVTEGN